MCTISLPVPQSPPFTEDSGLPRCKTEPWHIVFPSSASPPATPCCRVSVARALVTSQPASCPWQRAPAIPQPGSGSGSESTRDSDHAPVKKVSPTPESCSSPPRTSAGNRSERTCVARCVAKQVGSVAKVVPVAEAACGLCNCSVSSGDEKGGPILIDGRLVCQQCIHFIEGIEFVPSYSVCLNPLCRRKWKQLTPKMLPHFCPTCKRNLEEGVPGRNHVLAAALMEQMYRRWQSISTELAETLGEKAMPVEPLELLPSGGLFGSTQAYWRDILDAFKETFPPAPPVEDVRNWNSVHGRRKLYRGVIHRDHRRFVVTVEALEELNEAFAATRRVPVGARDFLLLDWHQQHLEGQEVNFVAFPNPAVSERGSVSKIVRLLNSPDCHPQTQVDGANGPNFEVDNTEDHGFIQMTPRRPKDQVVPQLSLSRVKEGSDFNIRAPATGSHSSSSDAKERILHQPNSSDTKARPQMRLHGPKVSPQVGSSNDEGPAAIGNDGFDTYRGDSPKMTQQHPVSGSVGSVGSVDTSQGQTPCSAFADLVQWSAEKDSDPAVLLRSVNAGLASANLAAFCGGFGSLSWECVLQCIANAPNAPAAPTNPPWQPVGQPVGQAVGQAVGHSISGNQNHNRATESGLPPATSSPPPASPCSPPLPPRLGPQVSAPPVHRPATQSAALPSGMQNGLQSAPHASGKGTPWASPQKQGLRPTQQLLRTPPFRSPFAGKGRSPFAAYFDD